MKRKAIKFIKTNKDAREALAGERARADAPSAGELAVIESAYKKAVARAAKRRLRRMALLRVAAAAFALLVIFLAATPPGRAFAVNTFHAAIRFVDGSLRLSSDGMNENALQPYAFVRVQPGSFDSLDEAFAHIDVRLPRLDALDAQIVKVEVLSNDSELNVLTIYDIDNDGLADLLFDQSVFSLHIDFGISYYAREAEFAAVKLPVGETIHWVTTPDGMIAGIIQWENYTASLVSGTLPYERLLEYARKIKR